MPVNILITFIIGSALGWILIKVTVAPQHLKGLILGYCASGMYVCLFNFNGLLYRIYMCVCARASACICACCSTIYPVKHSCITLDTRNSVCHLLLLFFQQNQNVHVLGFCNQKHGQFAFNNCPSNCLNSFSLLQRYILIWVNFLSLQFQFGVLI